MEICPVADARFGFTTTTSTWASGHVGPLMIVFGEGTISEEQVRRLNEKYVSRIFIFTSGRDTHFMNATAVLEMLETCLVEAFALRRLARGRALEALL